MKYLIVVSGVFAALFFLLLIRKNDKEYEHKFLATIFFLITINSIYVLQFYRSDVFYYVPFFSELNYAIPLLYAPLFWFYAKSTTQANFKVVRKDKLHLLPFIIFLVILISPLLFDIKLMDSKHVGYPFIKLLITPFYLFSILLILHNYRKKLLEEYSYEVEVNLMWLTWITIGAILLWIIALGGYLYNSFNDVQKTILYDNYVLSFLSFFLFALTYVAITKTDIFHTPLEKVKPKKITIEPSNPKPKDTEDFKNELEELKKIMAEKRPYLDPLLSITKLSEITKIPQYKISKILNNHLDQSFYDFINGYRIEEVKLKMISGQAKELSILGIATESGFNSKASFNRVFKKKEGITPSTFLKSIK